jgi:excisionase family DNA binding protein
MKPADLVASLGPLPDEALKPLTVDIKTACRLVGIGHSTLWKLISSGKLKSISIGRRRLIIYSSLEQLVLGPTLERILAE